MKILVLGGDGFCGWPCAVNLADQGHDVLIVDNLSRRKIDVDLEVDSLTPIRSIGERLKAWEEIGGKPIGFTNLDISKQYQRLLDLLIAERPEAIEAGTASLVGTDRDRIFCETIGLLKDHDKNRRRANNAKICSASCSPDMQRWGWSRK